MQDQQGPDGHEYGGVYRSADGGDTWERINSVNPRPMYYSQIRVDPSNNSYIYVLGTSLYRSSDGGSTFTGDGARGGVHVDHHAMWINPNDGRHMVLGNDGGIYVTCDRMERWDHLNHMAIGQFYHVIVGPRKNYMVYGGLQDNGSWGGPSRSRSGAGPINEDWIRIGGGDGFVCLVDPNDPDQLFFESQNGGTGRRNLRTGERGFIRPRAPRGERYRFNWRTPFILSHHNSGIYYSAGNHVFRSLWRGDDIKAISPEITKTDRGSATALAESPLDADVLYVGTDDGALWMTRDGGAEWIDLYSITAEDLAAKPEAEAEGESGEPDAAGGRGDRGGPGGRRGGGRMLEMLRESDANGDGKIQRSEVPERAGGMFDRIDGNGDGVIDQAEIKAVAERFGGETTESAGRADAPAGSGRSGRRGGRMARQLIEADANDDGKIEKSEAPAQLWALFDRLDEDDDGVLLVAELQAPPAGAGERAQASEAATETSEAAATEVSEEAAAPAAEPSEDAPAVDDPVTGVWDAKATAENIPPDAGNITLTLVLAADGTVTGRLTSQFNDGEIIPGKFDREKGLLTFGFEGEQMGFDINATVKGTSMTGTINIGEGMFSMEFTATRIATESPADEAAAEEPVDDGYDWKPIAELVPDPRWVSCLETSRASASRVYLTFDGHRSDDDEPHVFVSENHGRSWRSISANLPTSAGTTRVIREDLTNPDILYLGTEFGAWVSIDRGASWQSLNTNLPTVAIHELAQHPTVSEMAAATHGRSIWILDVTPIRQMTGETVASDAHLYRPSAVTYWRTEPGRGGDLRRFVGSNRAERADIYYSLNGNARRVRLHIEDAAGETIATLEPETGSGLHRVSWNMQRQVEDDGQQRGRRGRAPRVAPGIYTVVLEVNGEDHSQPLVVTGDPEFPDAVLWGEEYERQLEIERELMSGDDDEGQV
jgi:Ca2+-binding EF-hand superfamily protein